MACLKYFQKRFLNICLECTVHSWLLWWLLGTHLVFSDIEKWWRAICNWRQDMLLTRSAHFTLCTVYNSGTVQCIGEHYTLPLQCTTYIQYCAYRKKWWWAICNWQCRSSWHVADTQCTDALAVRTSATLQEKFCTISSQCKIILWRFSVDYDRIAIQV